MKHLNGIQNRAKVAGVFNNCGEWAPFLENLPEIKKLLGIGAF
jgi:hypothetical protein